MNFVTTPEKHYRQVGNWHMRYLPLPSWLRFAATGLASSGDVR